MPRTNETPVEVTEPNPYEGEGAVVQDEPDPEQEES
jgi:hypothetical protein